MRRLNLQTFHRLAWLLLLVTGLLAPLALQAEDAKDTKPALPIKSGVPAGFEQLAGPQETMLDVFFGGIRLGNFRAVFNPKNVAFATPDEIIAQIPALKEEATAKVKQALSGDLERNSSLICGHIPTQDCGILKPEVAGVIFYEDSFRVDLFVNPSLLELQDTHRDKILPPAPDIFSGVHQINGNITGSNSSQEFSILTNSTLAYGPERLQFIGIASNQQKQVNTFTASLDKWGLENKFGLFNSAPLQLLPQTAMGGVSVSTSLKTNLALRETAGNTLEVFLPERSYVSLVYNNIIYSTELYEAGNQVINTSALPEGSYDVTLRIRTLAGTEHEEKRFFAKNFAIPPKDQPIYFAQMGTVRNPNETNAFSSITNDLIATLGAIRRITEWSALDVDLLYLKDKLYTEAGAFFLLPPDHQIRFSALASTATDFGIGASYLGYFLDKKMSIYANFRDLFAGDNASPSSATEPTEPITGDSRQYTSGLSYQIMDRLNLGLEGNYTQSDGGGKRYAYGPKLRYDFWREKGNSLTLTSSYNNTERGAQGTIFLNFSMRLGDWGYSGQAGLTSNPQSASFASGYNKSLDGRITWNDDKNPSHSTVIGAETRYQDSSTSHTADVDHRADYGNYKLIATETETSSGNSNFYSGNMGINIVHTAHDFAWGGKQQDSSGFIFKNEGNSSGVPMQVMVNGIQRATFETGKSTPLLLSPYQTYKVSIKPVESSPVDYDGSVKSITLYPGNIMPLIWDINAVRVVIGHVVLPDGTPLQNAKLEEARNITVTDESGLFQGEVINFKTLTFKRLEEKPSLFKNQGIDDFSLPPMPKSYPLKASNMSLEEQRKAILDIFDTQEESTQQQALPPATATAKDPWEPLLTPLQKLRDASPASRRIKTA